MDRPQLEQTPFQKFDEGLRKMLAANKDDVERQLQREAEERKKKGKTK